MEREDNSSSGSSGSSGSSSSSSSDSSSMEALIERNQELERENKKLKTENEHLQRAMRKSRRRFPKLVQWDRLDIELKMNREEERSTLELVKELKKIFREVKRENRRKEEVVRRLTAKLSKRRAMKENTERLVTEGTKLMAKKDEDKGKDAAKIFPEEIWEMFLDKGKVENPQDRWSSYNTCRLFQRILQKWETTWTFEQALLYLFPHLSSEVLLKCRLVSKGWEEVVDEFLRNHPSLRPHNEETCNPRLLPFVDPRKEKGLDDVNRFMFSKEGGAVGINLEDENYLQVTNRKLLEGRTVILHIDCYEDDYDDDDDEEDPDGVALHEAMWRQVYNFFRTFGATIWYLTFQFEQNEYASAWTVRKIRRFLFVDLFRFVPNLRKLTLEEPPRCDAWEDDEVEINQEEPPHLPNLESLDTDLFYEGSFRYIPELLQVIRRYHTQLKRLKLENTSGRWRNAYDLAWPNLTEQHLHVNSLDRLALLPRMDMPNLMKLGLAINANLDVPEDVRDENFSQFLQILIDLSTTTRLSTLRLDGSVIMMLKVLGETPVAACIPPTVKTLELDNNTNSVIRHPDYRFLLYFPHVENINVFYRNGSGAEIALKSDEEIEASFESQPAIWFVSEMLEAAKLDREREVVEVNRYVYTGEMYRSNIWDLLPRLKVFTFQWRVYTRGGYEEYCSKRR